jgi:hypothetical protein
VHAHPQKLKQRERKRQSERERCKTMTFGRHSHAVQQKTTKQNTGNPKCSVKYNIKCIIADLNLKNVYLISGGNDK